MSSENPTSDGDCWYTESWTGWRILELWARTGVVALWLALLTLLAGQVSKDFLIVALYGALAVVLLDAVLPD